MKKYSYTLILCEPISCDGIEISEFDLISEYDDLDKRIENGEYKKLNPSKSKKLESLGLVYFFDPNEVDKIIKND